MRFEGESSDLLHSLGRADDEVQKIGAVGENDFSREMEKMKLVLDYVYDEAQIVALVDCRFRRVFGYFIVFLDCFLCSELLQSTGRK